MEKDAASSVAQTHWQAEYDFWHKIITQEVERLRFNGGYEPIDIDLYQTGTKNGPAFIGKTRVGHTIFRVTGRWEHDPQGLRVLRVRILST